MVSYKILGMFGTGAGSHTDTYITHTARQSELVSELPRSLLCGTAKVGTRFRAMAPLRLPFSSDLAGLPALLRPVKGSGRDATDRLQPTQAYIIFNLVSSSKVSIAVAFPWDFQNIDL